MLSPIFNALYRGPPHNKMLDRLGDTLLLIEPIGMFRTQRTLVELRLRDLEASHNRFGVMCEADAVHAVS